MFNLKEGSSDYSPVMKGGSVCSHALKSFPQFSYRVHVGLCAMFSCLLTEGHAGDMKGVFVTYLRSNIEALVYYKSTVLPVSA